MKVLHLFSSPTPPNFSSLIQFGTPVLRDWEGLELVSPANFLFWLDDGYFHFLASHAGSSGVLHPHARALEYHAELWRYDVAEFFLTSPDRSRYLEFNLAPNGAWWSCLFSAPRQPARDQPRPVPGVIARASQTHSSWSAMASIPVAYLQDHLDFSPSSPQNFLNSNFILNSPDQVFLTASPLGEGTPDFHRPDLFPPIKIIHPA